MKTLILSLFSGISYAASVDGLAALSMQGFIGVMIFGTLSSMFLIRYINSNSSTSFPKSV